MARRTFKPVDVTSLSELLQSITKFPATSSSLAKTARNQHADPTVVSFFESMPASKVIMSKQGLFRQAFEAEVEVPNAAEANEEPSEGQD